MGGVFTSNGREYKMRVWSSILGVSLLTGGIWSAEITRAGDSSEASSPNDREGKFFSVFQIVKFKSEACTANTGEMGTCYTESECTAAGGTAAGSCASSFGSCCTRDVYVHHQEVRQ